MPVSIYRVYTSWDAEDKDLKKMYYDRVQRDANKREVLHRHWDYIAYNQYAGL
jgi:hypothetical protein